MHRGDHDAATSVFAPTAVLDTSVGRFEGHTELRRFFEEWGGGFETLEAEPEQIDDLGNGVSS
jgi:hypothetical protein